MQVDGYIARKYDMMTVLGTILDPAADKALMTTLTITLAMKGMLPSTSFPAHRPRVNSDALRGAQYPSQ